MSAGLRVLGLATLVTVLVFAFTPAANILARSVAVPARLVPADAIVVLGGPPALSNGTLSGQSLKRAMRGIDLYRAGLAPLLVFSGNDPDARHAESRGQAAVAGQSGVPREASIFLSGAHTTHEEASRLKPILTSRGIARILLVTDADHMIRAAPLFEHTGFTVFAAPVDEPETDLAPDARLDLLVRTVRELAGIVYYRAAGYL